MSYHLHYSVHLMGNQGGHQGPGRQCLQQKKITSKLKKKKEQNADTKQGRTLFVFNKTSLLALRNMRQKIFEVGKY